MENSLRKIIASSLLAVFIVSNTLLTVGAMEDARPALRDSNREHSVKLKGDINFINSNDNISLSLRDSDVKQVLRMFADKAGMNIIFHNSVEGNVTLDLVDVPLNTAFDMIININNLNYAVEDNTIVVAKAGTEGFNMGKQDMTLIPVKYISAAPIAEFLNKNIFGMNKAGLSGSDIVSTNPSTNEIIIFGSANDVALAKKIIAKFDVKPTTTTFKVNHTTPAEMAGMICDMLLPSTSGGSGSSTGGAAGIMTGAAADEGGGSAGDIVMNTGKVACTLDGKVDNSFGMQNLTVSYFTQQGILSIIGGSEQQLEMIKDFIAATDKKQPQAYLEVSIIELNEAGSKSLQNTWELLSKHFSARFDGQLYTVPSYPTFIKGNGYDVRGEWVKEERKDRTREVYNPLSGKYESIQYTEVIPGYYETIGRVGKWGGGTTLTYAINYLVESGKGRVVVNPRVVITNGVEAKIKVTEDYVKEVDVDSSTSSGGTVVTRDYNTADDMGFQLSIMPFISPDGYVTLNITPQYSTLKGQVMGNDQYAGSYIAATLLSHRDLDLKNLRIKDNETFVIAGMIQETEQKTVQKVPVLGDLPLIGALFRNTSSSKGKSEMVIMITPKIITDNEDAVGNSDAL